MKDRIKELRQSLGMTQAEFAGKLGIKPAAISNYEIGRNEPIDAVVSLICREFGVSETWLRTGDGEMFVPRTRLEEITRRVAELAGDEPNPFREKLLLALLRIPPEKWGLIEQVAREILAEDPGADDPMETEEPPETEKGQEP